MTERRTIFVMRVTPSLAFRIFVAALHHDGFWLGVAIGAYLASLPWVVLR